LVPSGDHCVVENVGHQSPNDADTHPRRRKTSGLRKFRGTPNGAGGGLQAPQTRENRNVKNTDFVDIMISEVLRDFLFSRNQTLKSADNKYIRILKNKLIKLKKTKR
jgi:hypothetical protein